MKIRFCLLVLLIALSEQSTYAVQSQSASGTAKTANLQFTIDRDGGDTVAAYTANLRITAPAGVSLDKVQISLNGKDVRSRFSYVSCATTSLSGSISAADVTIQ